MIDLLSYAAALLIGALIFPLTAWCLLVSFVAIVRTWNALVASLDETKRRQG